MLIESGSMVGFKIWKPLGPKFVEASIFQILEAKKQKENKKFNNSKNYIFSKHYRYVAFGGDYFAL